MVMENKKKAYDNFKFCLIAGLFLTGISVLLFCLLGKDSFVTYHDQLDGEVLCYLYQAKYMFRGNVIPELMNGVGKTALTAPALLLVFVYKVLPPFVAFVVSQYFVMLAGFTGMYLLLTKWNVRPLFAAMCGVVFAYLPLLPVYGLSMYGVPLVIWAVLSLAEEECVSRKTLIFFGVIVLFGVSSSLVLSGFAVLGMMVFLGLFYKKFRKNGLYWVGVGTLLITYLICNWSLFAQILGFGESYVTHKGEFTISSTPFLDTFWNTLIHGVEHAQAYQEWIVALAFIIILAGLEKKEWRNQQWKLVCLLFAIGVAIAALCAVYNAQPIVALRQEIGGVAIWLQLDRIYWLYPALWYVALGICMQWFWQVHKGVFWCFGFVFYLVTAVTVLLAGNWKTNVKKVLNPDAPGISWEDFYAEDVFEQIEDYIYETTAQEKEEYRVASLGICPGAALYNGFYCLDGYSNNYPVEYKHTFRKIIEPELDKSEYLAEYFDEWGNRCYLFSAEIPGYYTVEKGGFYFSDFAMNVGAFEEMGGRYVFSAAYIDGAEDTGLKLLREEPFETEDSYYKIYIYGLDK